MEKQGLKIINFWKGIEDKSVFSEQRKILHDIYTGMANNVFTFIENGTMTFEDAKNIPLFCLCETVNLLEHLTNIVEHNESDKTEITDAFSSYIECFGGGCAVDELQKLYYILGDNFSVLEEYGIVWGNCLSGLHDVINFVESLKKALKKDYEN